MTSYLSAALAACLALGAISWSTEQAALAADAEEADDARDTPVITVIAPSIFFLRIYVLIWE